MTIAKFSIQTLVIFLLRQRFSIVTFNWVPVLFKNRKDIFFGKTIEQASYQRGS